MYDFKKKKKKNLIVQPLKNFSSHVWLIMYIIETDFLNKEPKMHLQIPKSSVPTRMLSKGETGLESKWPKIHNGM